MKSYTLGKFNQPFNFSVLKSLKILGINTKFTTTIPFYFFPPSLLELYIPYYYTYGHLIKSCSSLVKFVLSGNYLTYPLEDTVDLRASFPSLKIISCSGIFERPLVEFPASITHIKFSRKFNQNVDDLPPLLTWVDFGEVFHQKVDHLPASIKFIKFGEFFNTEVDHLPSSLKSLYFGEDFNQPINKLPVNLKTLYISGKFLGFADCLPAFLHKLTLRYKITDLESQGKFKHVMEMGFSFPDTLKVLNFGMRFFNNIDEEEFEHSCATEIQNVIDNLPSSLEDLTLSCPILYVDNLPPNVTKLTLDWCQNITSVDNLPDSLIYFYLTHSLFLCSTPMPLDHLPTSLTHLLYDAQEDNSPNLDHLPSTLR